MIHIGNTVTLMPLPLAPYAVINMAELGPRLFPRGHNSLEPPE